jgi:hypothetical protein
LCLFPTNIIISAFNARCLFPINVADCTYVFWA